MPYEDNPFEKKQVAEEWITSVEREEGMIRDREIYPMLENWVEEINPQLVVEIGSGQGICSDKLGDYKGSYVGVEPSEHLVQRANNIYPDKRRRFIIGNAYHLPLTTEVADAGFSVNVWFHLESLSQASAELARVLKPEGHYLIVTANPDAEEIWDSFYFDKTNQDKVIRGKVNVPVIPLSDSTFYKHSLVEIIQALEAVGLSVEETKIFGINENLPKPIFLAVLGRKVSPQA